MTHAALARWLLALLCAAQGAGTAAIDLNRTHATNPRWPAHARFHLVWQVVSYAFLSLFEIALIFAPCPLQQPRFYLAAALAVIPMMSCLAAFFLRKIYGGSIFNRDGIAPMKIVVRGSELHIDLNLTAEAVALLSLIGIVALFRN
jgi:hypothetical protein